MGIFLYKSISRIILYTYIYIFSFIESLHIINAERNLEWSNGSFYASSSRVENRSDFSRIFCERERETKCVHVITSAWLLPPIYSALTLTCTRYTSLLTNCSKDVLTVTWRDKNRIRVCILLFLHLLSPERNAQLSGCETRPT